eukprot:5086722-Pleurochrysis_carterae.AAC.1
MSKWRDGETKSGRRGRAGRVRVQAEQTGGRVHSGGRSRPSEHSGSCAPRKRISMPHDRCALGRA